MREWIRVQAELIREQSGKGIHIIEQLRESSLLQQDGHQDDRQEYDDETQEEELDPEVLSLMTAQGRYERETGQRWMEYERQGAWCKCTWGSPIAGR